jgi:large subunit ribosomal protein L4
MSVATYTKTGNKATTSAKLDKNVFEVTVENHELIKQAYVAYLANGRENLAVTKTRGLVRGGGKKPWKQKGTGRARFGSSRVPIWRGGGITFGPTGEENYSKKMHTKAKRQAIRQALSMANQEGRISVVEAIVAKDGKTKEVQNLLTKLGITRRTLIVVDTKETDVVRATQNLGDVTLVTAKYLNVFDIVNAHHIVISQKSLDIISEWLGEAKATAKPVSKKEETK